MTQIDRKQFKTTWSVKAADHVSSYVITIGGLATIVAVLLVSVYLFYVAAPLMGSGTITGEQQVQAQVTTVVDNSVRSDENSLLIRSLSEAGAITVQRISDGQLLMQSQPPMAPEEISTLWSDPLSEQFLIGLKDGRIIAGRAIAEYSIFSIRPHDAPEMVDGEVIAWHDGLLERKDAELYRYHRVTVTYDAPLGTANGNEIIRLDRIESNDGSVMAACHEDGSLAIYGTNTYENLMTGEIVVELESTVGKPVSIQTRGMPTYMYFLGQGEHIALIWEDGLCERYQTRNEIRHIESCTLIHDEVDQAKAVTACSLLLGRGSLLVGDDEGRVRVYFLIREKDGSTEDGWSFRMGHKINSASASEVINICSSERSRTAGILQADGTLRTMHITTEKEINLVTADVSESAVIGIGPRDDAILCAVEKGIHVWTVDPGHSDISVSALFLPVWYESYPEAEMVWQSSSASDDDEAKLGLTPLIVGTLKATLYSMLFAVPIALAAAIYTSEFMSPRIKAVIKPSIELMASLPSVVLGYFGAIILAPYFEAYLMEILCLTCAVPFTFAVGGLIFQSLPQHYVRLLQNYRLFFVAVCFAIGCVCAVGLAPIVTTFFFAGNFKQWLDGTVGHAFGGWWAVSIPVCCLTLYLMSERFVTPRVIAMACCNSQAKTAGMRFVQAFIVMIAGTCVAAAIAGLAVACGWDLRGSLFGSYESRNALIVGLVMGFAVIPIIYTIAEDALCTVPNNLRAASLGAGATQWQTAVRIVIPTAMSGIFSAIMVGLGRAVGETMIVLMAAGNTPVMDLNLFSGFRTLSANIAVEMPEAVKDSTHYRVLFLAAFVLFVMTFIVNTVAESVRQRFRKRAVNM